MDFGSDLVLRLFAQVRCTFHAAFDVAQMFEERCDFHSAESMQSGGKKLRVWLEDFSAAVEWLGALDRHEFVEKVASDAQIAHDNNDVRGCFAVVRALSGSKPRAHKTILKTW